MNVATAPQVKQIIEKTTQFFRDKGFESARLDTELLIASALKWERMKIYLNYEYPLSETELTACRELVKRRAAGEPVAYILGKKDFYNHSFKVSPAVLIPRPETEQIVEETLKWLHTRETKNIIDLGTGSGCIGLSILAEEPEAQLAAVDISADAIGVARENAEAIGVVERAHFFNVDAVNFQVEPLAKLFGGQLADVVVANPPYIAPDDANVEANVKRYEPAQALFSPDRGLQHIRAWAAKAAEVVSENGMVMFEIGFEQGRAAFEIFEAVGRFKDIRIEKDLSGRERFVRANRI